MQALLTKKQAAQYLGLQTKAAEKLLERLGVCKIDYSLLGSKGIRYRKNEIEEALRRLEVDKVKKNKRHKPKKQPTNFFDLPVKEQEALLTACGPRQ